MTARPLLLLALGLLAGCTTPKEIDGHKVIGTRWVNGQGVYIVEGDQEAMRRGAAAANAATQGMVLQPVK